VTAKFLTCTNCGQDGAAHLSLDFGQPQITLCDWCALAMPCNQELFRERGEHYRRTGKPAPAPKSRRSV
jgi:hypothetical protein